MKNFLQAFLFFAFTNLFAQLPPQQPLYPNGIEHNPIFHPEPEMYADSAVHPNSTTGKNRVFRNVTNPTYMLFSAENENNKGIGLVIFPGGGLRTIWLDKEGTDLALWLSEQGISCMVVKYRTNRMDEIGSWEIDYGIYKSVVYEDARTAMLTMKTLADSLSFERNKVGMIGFSDGGWLVENMVYKYYQGEYEWKPAFVGLLYHGSNIREIENVKDKHNLPPFFMAIASDDAKLPVSMVIPYLSKVATDVKGSELHIFPNGGHGFGLGYGAGTSLELWKQNFLRWMVNL